MHGALTPRSFDLRGAGAVELIMDPPKEPTMYRLRYAAPEVVRREEPSQGTDVFALALVVRELIEGLPARRSTADELALDAVDGRVSAPHGLAGELQTVCVQAADMRAAERPGAAALVAALQGASKRRGPTGIEWMVGGVAALALVALGFILRTSAEARERSEGVRIEGRAAVEGFVTQTYAELDRMADVERLAAAGRHALASMERLREEDLSRADQQLFAQTLLWNAKAHRVLDEDARAEELFQRALDRAERLEEGKERSSIELHARIELASFARARGDRGAAGKLLRASVAHDIDAIEDGELDPELRLIRTRALMDLGDLVMSSFEFDADETGTLFEEARATLDTISGPRAERVALDVLELRSELDRIEANQAFLAQEEERGAQLLARHVGLAGDLVAQDPGVPRRRQLHARGADLLGRARTKLNDLDGSVEAFRIAVEAWNVLREMQPDDIRWRREWARSTSRLAAALGQKGEWQEATELQFVALGGLTEMLETGILGQRAALEIAQQSLLTTELRLAAGDIQRASDRLARVEPLLDRVPAGKGIAAAVEAERVRTRVVRAELQLAEGHWADASEGAMGALEVVEQLAMDGRDAGVREYQARALLVNAAVAATKGDGERARSLRLSALDIIVELESEGGAPRHLSLLARIHFVLGDDAAAAVVIERLDDLGYRGIELGAVRAATALLR